jgi:hypothetical protein
VIEDLAPLVVAIAAVVTREVLAWYDKRQRLAGKRRTRRSDNQP